MPDFRLVLFALLPLPLYAAEPLLVVRGEGNYPPYEMVVDGKLTGAHIELIEAAAHIAGYQLTIQSVAWARALEMTKRGLASAVSFASRTPERESWLLFDEGNVLSTLRFGFFSLKQPNSPTWNGSFTSLHSYKIGVARAYAYPTEFSSQPGLQKYEQDGGYEALLRTLHNKRVDLIVGGVLEINTSAKQLGYADSIQLLSPTFGATASYLAFGRQSSNSRHAERMAAAFSKLKLDGSYQRILTKYGL
ncbi:substrate-binding periplasmic protein [Chitinimonas sp. JJ19]|uniref:substrate-binding periplasmic protein n=1 Tax=Chitinimonas sp. JJ19 TaxID=3109352 RepID=UPI0030025853